jgi:DNA-directed RNA polymerase specialized sigma24 family protein
MPVDDPAEVFTGFVREVEPRLRQSLMAAFGGDAGREATAEALAWAWEHWSRLEGMANPAGYLYRLGKNRATTVLRRRRVFPLPPRPSEDGPWVEPGLPAALAHLSEGQRVAVLLIHGFGWTYREVADHLGVKISTAQTHAERGMAKLRHHLKVETHA